MNIDEPLLAVARRRHGLVSLDDWLRLGRECSAFYRAIRCGLLVGLGPGVAALVGTPLGPRQQLSVGLFVAGPGAMVSHRSGAWAWGAPVPAADPVHLIGRTAGRQRTTDRRWCIHRPTDRDRVRAVRRQGLMVTTPGRTLLDVGAFDPGLVDVVLESFLRDAHVTLPAVTGLLARSRRRGRPGVTALDRPSRRCRTGAWSPTASSSR